MPFGGWPAATPSSRRGSLDSCSTRLPERPVTHPPRRPSTQSSISSQREREVLRLIARGYTYKEVGRQLTISVKTVESHVSAVLRKLQLSTRHQLTYWAAERRLL